MMDNGQDDWELLARASVDRQALQILFERHKDYVYRLARGLLLDQSLADDVVQSVFLRLWEKEFNLQPNAKFTTWLYRFALNVSRETGRKKRCLPAAAYAEAAELDELAVDDSGNEVINFYDLQKALTQIPQRQREVFILRYLEGFSTRETAQIVGCSEGTVKTHLARAAAKIESFFSAGSDKHSDAGLDVKETSAKPEFPAARRGVAKVNDASH